MKWYLFLIGFLSFPLLGQEKESIFFNILYNHYKENPLLFYEFPIENFTISSFSFEHNKGLLKLAQQASEKQNITLKTYGVYRHKKTMFLGNLQVDRVYENAKRWNLTFDEVNEQGIMPNPHYFAVDKASKWASLHYKSNAGFVQPIIDKIWDFSTTVTYNLSEKYRTEYDPRPTILYNQLSINTTTGIKIKKYHKIGFGFGFGISKTNNNISYSDNYTQSPHYFDKYNRWMLGYGTIQNSRFNSNKDYNKENQSFISYLYTKNFQKFSAKLHYTKNQINTFYNNSEYDYSNDVIASFTSYSLNGNVAYYQKKRNGNQFFITISFNNFLGENYLFEQSGKNYITSANQLKTSWSFLKSKSKKLYEYGFFFSLNKSYQKDALSNTITDRGFAEISPYVSKEFSLYKNKTIIPKISFLYRIKTHNLIENNNLDYHKTITETDYSAKTIQLFYNNVVYKDYEYFNKNQYQINLNLNMKIPMKKQNFILVGLTTGYITNFEKYNNERYFLSSHISINY